MQQTALNDWKTKVKTKKKETKDKIKTFIFNKVIDNFNHKLFAYFYRLKKQTLT